MLIDKIIFQTLKLKSSQRHERGARINQNILVMIFDNRKNKTSLKPDFEL